MSRPEGLPKTGGRKKGTANKKTFALQEALDQHGLDVIGQLTDLLPKLPEEKRADVLIDMMTYLYPKRKAIEQSTVSVLSPEEVTILEEHKKRKSLTDGEIKARLKEIQEKLAIPY